MKAKSLLFFISGVAIGAVGTILMTPVKGTKGRKALAKQQKKYKKAFKESAAKYKEKLRDVKNDAEEKGRDIKQKFVS